MQRLAQCMLVALASCALAACDDGEVDPDAGAPDSGSPDPMDAGPDAFVEPDTGVSTCEGPPGLYETGDCTVIAAGVRAYQPRFGLWADGADKERYIELPAGATIDTFDPDNWVFPVGTRLYKTFLQDGVRLETRILEKDAPGNGVGAWDMRVYAWNEAQDAVTEVTNARESVRQNVLGTDHDIPGGADCVRCHGGLDVVNGFSAIQLNHDLGGVTLQTLLDEGALTQPIAPADADAPGDATAEAALGYLHANCGHCHRENASDASAMVTGLWMWINVDDTTAEETDAYTTAVGERASYFHPSAFCRIHPGAPDTSLMTVRMGERGDRAQMPPIATEQPDPAGIAAVSAWIAAVTGDATACTP